MYSLVLGPQGLHDIPNCTQSASTLYSEPFLSQNALMVIPVQHYKLTD